MHHKIKAVITIEFSGAISDTPDFGREHILYASLEVLKATTNAYFKAVEQHHVAVAPLNVTVDVSEVPEELVGLG